MPPPPVAGAAAGTGLATAVCVTVTVTVSVGVGLVLAVALALALALAVSVLLAEIEDVGEPVPPGENDTDGPAEGVDPEQAERVTEASNAMVLHPVMASLALSPVFAPVVRTFMEPPPVATRPLPRSPKTFPKRQGP